jgi:hypothetical protein
LAGNAYPRDLLYALLQLQQQLHAAGTQRADAPSSLFGCVAFVLLLLVGNGNIASTVHGMEADDEHRLLGSIACHASQARPNETGTCGSPDYKVTIPKPATNADVSRV